MSKANTFTLDNGLKFIVMEDHSSPAACMSLWVRAGVCDEPADKRGIAHYFEHMMFRGSLKFGPKQHTRIISNMGGDCNAFTNYDMTVYHETFPSENIEKIFELEADRFMELKLIKESADDEKKVVMEEFRVNENQPFTKALRQLFRDIGGDHPYAIDPLGTRENVESITIDDLINYYNRLYRPNNAFAVVCGDIDTAHVKDLAAKHFGRWERSNIQKAEPQVLQIKTGYLKKKLSFEVPATALAFKLPCIKDLDVPALDLISMYLGSSESSPVNDILVKKSRLCVEAGLIPIKLMNGGALVIFGAFLPPGSYEARRNKMREICDKFIASDVNSNDFAAVIKRFKSGLISARYEIVSQMYGLGGAEFRHGDFRKYEQLLEDIKSVDSSRAEKLARQLFEKDNQLELDIVPENQKWWMPLAGLAFKLFKR